MRSAGAKPEELSVAAPEKPKLSLSLLSGSRGLAIDTLASARWSFKSNSNAADEDDTGDDDTDALQ